MSDPQEAATPSDPHSAEAEEREAWAAFVAGHASRDAEVAELKAKIADAWDEGYGARVAWDSYSLRYVKVSAFNPYRSASSPAVITDHERKVVTDGPAVPQGTVLLHRL